MEAAHARKSTARDVRLSTTLDEEIVSFPITWGMSVRERKIPTARKRIKERSTSPCGVNPDNPQKEACIQYDVLKELLVDRLPIGNHLMAVFDSLAFHSQSLLDLEHWRCNRVYVPWISKGRRKSDSIRCGTMSSAKLLSAPIQSSKTRESSQIPQSYCGPASLRPQVGPQHPVSSSFPPSAQLGCVFF
ncbi:hypothetical protein VKT23_014103 [Stygiomarasmius scandens]|uniref:Transposase n=1 Tax=Marasmiellus scandens TaxID=2682957 RepID=A0ABR1J1J1_9AGAR